MAEHLVPAASDRLVGQRQHPGEHVADAVVTRDLSRTCQVEATGPVVQQRRIGGSQGGGDGGIALVAGRSDRVEAGALLAQPARRVIDVAAEQLRLEQLERHRPRQRRTGTDRLLAVAEVRRRLERADVVEQRLFEPIEVVDLRIVGVVSRAHAAHTNQASRVIGTCSDGRA